MSQDDSKLGKLWGGKGKTNRQCSLHNITVQAVEEIEELSIYTPWIDSGQQKGHTAKQAVSWIERILVPRPIQIAVSNLLIIPWLNEEWESPLKGETIVSTMS